MRKVSKGAPIVRVSRVACTQIPKAARVLVACVCGILECVYSNGMTVIKPMVLWHLGMVTVNDGVYPLEYKPLRVPGKVQRMQCVKLVEAHTPHYHLERLGDLLVNRHRHESSLYAIVLSDGWHAVVQVTPDGYVCTRCDKAFKTPKEWCEHYGPFVRVPMSLPWHLVTMNDNVGAVVLKAVEKLPTPTKRATSRQIYDHTWYTKNTFVRPWFQEAVVNALKKNKPCRYNRTSGTL